MDGSLCCRRGMHAINKGILNALCFPTLALHPASRSNMAPYLSIDELVGSRVCVKL